MRCVRSSEMYLKIILILFVTITLSSAEFDDDTQNLNAANTDLNEETVKPSRLFKRHNRHFKYVDAEFEGVADPVIEKLKSKRISPQWFITNYNGALKFGADTQIHGTHIESPLREIMKLSGDSRNIIILSGGHGNELGNNWIKVTDILAPPATMPTIRRKPWQYDSDFWVEDVERYMGRIGDVYQPLRSRLSIVDIAEMSINRFRDIIQSNSHVILGFCFGRNDRAYRYYLNLNPVISKVNPPRL